MLRDQCFTYVIIHVVDLLFISSKRDVKNRCKEWSVDDNKWNNLSLCFSLCVYVCLCEINIFEMVKIVHVASWFCFQDFLDDGFLSTVRPPWVWLSLFAKRLWILCSCNHSEILEQNNPFNALAIYVCFKRNIFIFSWI